MNIRIRLFAVLSLASADFIAELNGVATGDAFGWSVAVTNTLLGVGANNAYSEQGAVYIYSIDSSTPLL